MGSAIGVSPSGHELTKQVSVDPDYETEVQQNTQCSFITGNRVNVRSGPGKSYSAIAQLNRGDGVRALYREGDWVKLAARVDGFEPDEAYEPLDGWVHNQYINGCSEDQFDMWRTSE
ncbi:MAG TPA: SH3 domain-containing protein [Leptolyngbyaceae cyanobacterium]